jgi:hypothetical protein
MPRELTKLDELLLELAAHPTKSDTWAICCDANKIKSDAFLRIGYEKSFTRIELGDVQIVLQALIAYANERLQEEGS